MNIFERFDETKLPNKEHFYSTLNEKHISGKGYEDALRICNESEMENMRKYHESGGVLRNGVLKICREHICRRTPMPKCDCNKVALELY